MAAPAIFIWAQMLRLEDFPEIHMHRFPPALRAFPMYPLLSRVFMLVLVCHLTILPPEGSLFPRFCSVAVVISHFAHRIASVWSGVKTRCQRQKVLTSASLPSRLTE